MPFWNQSYGGVLSVAGERIFFTGVNWFLLEFTGIYRFDYSGNVT